MMMKTQGQEQNGQIQAQGGDDADHVDSDRLITANTMGCLMLLTQLTKDSKQYWSIAKMKFEKRYGNNSDTIFRTRFRNYLYWWGKIFLVFNLDV